MIEILLGWVLVSLGASFGWWLMMSQQKREEQEEDLDIRFH